MHFSGKLLNYFHMNTTTTYFLINMDEYRYSTLYLYILNLGIYNYIRQMSFCHNMKETLGSNTFEKVNKWQDICKMYSF